MNIPPLTAPTDSFVGANHVYRSWIGGQCSDLETLPFWLSRGVSQAQADIIVANFMTIITDIIEGNQNVQSIYVGQIVTGIMLEMPNGWIRMDGQQVLVSNYPLLANVVPVGWVTGTVITLPDMAQRGTFGRGDFVGIQPPFKILGATGGSASHTLSIAEMPSHNHAPSVGTQFLVSTPSTTGIVANPAFPVGGGQTGNRGGGFPHNNMPPFLVVNYFIYGGI